MQMGFASSNQAPTERTSMPDDNVDLFVIGAGSGGVRAARIAAGHGARVMIAEEYRVGGTFVIPGRRPQKPLGLPARVAARFESTARSGLRAAQTLSRLAA